MISIVKRKIDDEKLIGLIRIILEYNEKSLNISRERERESTGVGMPKGNYTSQFFANVYLNELDYFVKHMLKAKYYIRYVDDFVILHRNKEILLEYKRKIEDFLKTLKIELHPSKSNVYSLYNGIDFLGFRIFYNYKILSKKNSRKIWKKVSLYKEMMKEDRISKDDVSKSIEGWNAYAMWGNTYKLRKRIKRRLHR